MVWLGICKKIKRSARDLTCLPYTDISAQIREGFFVIVRDRGFEPLTPTVSR
jgi:hypothetical protein